MPTDWQSRAAENSAYNNKTQIYVCLTIRNIRITFIDWETFKTAETFHCT